MNELLLQYLWNHKVFGTHLFQDTEGNPVKVLDFGSWNRDAGADFQVARIETNGIRFAERSEERRVGKECRSRWSPYH